VITAFGVASADGRPIRSIGPEDHGYLTYVRPPSGFQIFLEAQPGKKTQLHELRLFWLLHVKSLERFIERNNLVRGNRANESLVVVQFYTLMFTAMLDALLAASLLHENAAHGLCRGREVMAAMFPILLLFRVHQANIRFVHERRGLQGLTHWFPRQHAGRQTPQILVNQRQQLLESVIIAAPDGVQRLSDVAHTTEVTTATTAKQITCKTGGLYQGFPGPANPSGSSISSWTIL